VQKFLILNFLAKNAYILIRFFEDNHSQLLICYYDIVALYE